LELRAYVRKDKSEIKEDFEKYIIISPSSKSGIHNLQSRLAVGAAEVSGGQRDYGESFIDDDG
jgi:hypothetical protein